MSAQKKEAANLQVKESLIDEGVVQQALSLQKEKKISFEEAFAELGVADAGQLAKDLAKKFSLPFLDLEQFKPDKEVLGLVSPAFCRKHMIIPVSKVGARCIVVAFSDPSNLYAKDDLATVTQMTVQVVVASVVSIKESIDQHYAPQKNMNNMMEDLHRAEEDLASDGLDESSNIDDEDADAAVVKFVNAILSEAIQTKASDIHLEVYEKSCRVRYRIDGKLQERLFPPKGVAAAIASRIKIMSKLDIAEKRRPQDGRLKVRRSSGKEVDFRVSVIPVLFGEKIVMRLLDKSNLTADLHKLGLTERELGIIKKCITKPQGMVLMTGPTGSGKTTTIYSILNEINDVDTNISTAEDPVEYNIEGLNQVQVNSEIGFNFSDALRSFLRQDPDVIMVGEIRDKETSEIAFKAASTGHLVVSTLHTNDSIATVTRLVDIGVPPYMVAEVVSLVIAQRLVRTVCSNCAVDEKIDDQTLLELGVAQKGLGDYKNTKKGQGCSKCNNSGYRGRMPIFEILEMTTELRKAIIDGCTNAQMKKLAIKSGLATLRMSALSRLRDGLTTVQEVVNTSIKDDHDT